MYDDVKSEEIKYKSLRETVIDGIDGITTDNLLTGIKLMKKMELMRSFDMNDKKKSFLDVVNSSGIRSDYAKATNQMRRIYQNACEHDPMKTWTVNLENQSELFTLKCFEKFPHKDADLLLMKCFAMTCGINLIVATYDLV